MNAVGYDRWTDIVDRETSGEAVTDADRAFAREFEQADALASAEADLFDAFETLVELEGEDSSELAQKAVATALSRREGRSRVLRLRVAVTGLMLAAAAGAALWVSRPQREISPVAVALSAVEYVDGQGTLDGKAVGNDARVAVGAEVAVASGVLCVAVEPAVHVCLGEGSKIRVKSAGGSSKEVELVEGSLATALDPLPPGQRYSVLAGQIRVTAVGTAFTVEKLGASVRTIVHEGKVRVGDPTTGQLVTAHKIGLSSTGGVGVEDLVDHGPTETPEWKALAKVAHRSIEGALGAPPPAEPTSSALSQPSGEEPAKVEAAPSRPAVERHEPKARVIQSAEAPALTPSDLLARARQALRSQSWGDAAAAYRELIATFPSSAEARTALVPLAGLEIDRLGQPAVALGHLDSYLASPGALSMEARLSRIRALRALGRTSDEARAIDEFLVAHPNSLESERLRQRRETLPR